MNSVDSTLQDLLEEDELDLVKLVSSNANDANQYLIFEGSNSEYYALNVAKIEEILVFDEFEIAQNTDGGLIIGTAQIRGKMTPLVLFDAWFGNAVLDKKEYELMILASYGGHRLSMIVKRIEDIIVIESSEMQSNAQNNLNTTFITQTKLRGAMHLCTIFDSDKMLLDIFANETNQTHEILEKISAGHLSSKTVFFADDSGFIRRLVQKLFSQLGLTYQVFENGQELLDALANCLEDDIALVVTDIEMPIKSGHEVISTLRSNKKYDAINIIVHTNMANTQMVEALMRQGANRIIGKVDIPTLESAIREFIR